MKSRTRKIAALFLFAFLLSALAGAQDAASFEKRITVKKLPNGLTLLICERPEAPVFSFYTLVDAGSAQDPLGKTGLAHMFEHMAFKGTDKFGTTDYAAEKPALAKVEVAYAAYIAERDKTVGRDEARLKQLEKDWKDDIAAADKYVRSNEFGNIIEENVVKNANSADEACGAGIEVFSGSELLVQNNIIRNNNASCNAGFMEVIGNPERLTALEVGVLG